MRLIFIYNSPSRLQLAIKITAVCALTLLLVSYAGATIISVPTDHVSIQGAVNAAVAGDTIMVEDGVYLENVKIFGKKLCLASRYLLDRNPQHILHTIIDGSAPVDTDSGSCIVVSGATGAIIEGLTLSRGIGTLWFDPSDGKVYREGGGLLTDGGTVTVRHNLIVNNEAVIEDGTSAGGGGVRCGFGAINLVSNVIAYNTGLYGAGIVLFHAAGTITNNVIWKNTGGLAFGGGGLWIWSSTDPIISNNTVVENQSLTAAGGISLNDVTATMTNNIIRSNLGTTFPQMRIYSSASGSTVDYTDIQGGGFSGTGNFDRAPVWADSNFLLAPGSPCVDSGDIDPGARDVADVGNPSLAKFPSRNTRRNDMGAYGGPNAAEFPLFTSPRVGLDISSIDFGADTATHVTTRTIPLHKVGWGILNIDSIVFKPGQGLSSVTPLPHPVPVAFVDTITIQWNREVIGTLTDTAKIYHNDTSVANPLLVILAGEAIEGGCCVESTGNIDCDPGDGTDISDLAALIDNLYISFTPLCCKEEANIDGSTDGNADISDLSGLIDYLYITFTPPKTCQQGYR